MEELIAINATTTTTASLSNLTNPATSPRWGVGWRHAGDQSGQYPSARRPVSFVTDQESLVRVTATTFVELDDDTW